MTEFNHQSKGRFSGSASELDTKTDTKMSFEMDSTMYLKNTNIKLDALLGIDLNNNRYTFKDNKALINNLPLEFNGFVQLLDKGQQIDINFNNPEASFKDFLAVIPEAYSKNVKDVKTTGNFTLKGIVKGLVSDNTIPTLDINLVSNNASFQYPDLPKGVKNIVINASVKNKTGNVDDTFIDLNTLNFKIDEDVFKSEAHIKNLTKNISVNANLDGVLNLANITKAYPVEFNNQLSGILKAKLNTSFDMDAIEKNAYKRIKNNGSMSISNFVFSSEDIVNPIQINTADVNFKPGLISLDSFNAQTGKSDFSATGTINNLIGFLLRDKKLQGNFKVNSNQFAIADFMVEDETAVEGSNKTTSDAESLKIPEFLDCTITANAKTVLYDNLTLKNVKGQLRIKDQNANLSNMTTDIFNGKLGISGNVSTKEDKPKFDMDLGIQQFDISQSFKDLKMLTALAPIGKIIEGKLNSTINVSGLLDETFSPDLASISGKALAELLTQKVNTDNSPLLSSLDSHLNFINLDKLNLNDLKTKLSFDNGQVAIQPFNIKYDDINIQVSGTHSFTNHMNYKAVFNIPAKYLGSEVNQLIGKINDPEAENIAIPVTADISGTFTQPNVKTDLTSGVTNLTNQLIEIEKQKLLNKGTDKVNNLLGGLLGGTKNKAETPSDSTSNNNTTESEKDKLTKAVKDVLGGLFGGKKKKDKKKEKND